MQRIVVAPCSPFSVSRELMRDAALLAREHGVSAAHPPGRERQRHRLHAREVRLHAGRVRRAAGLGRPRRLACALRQARRRRHRAVRAHRHRRRALPGLEHAPGLGHRADPRDARRRRAGVDRRSTARPATTAATCWARRGWRCCCSAWRTARRPGAMTAREVLEIATLGGARVLGPRRHRRAGAGHGGRPRRRAAGRGRPGRRRARPAGRAVLLPRAAGAAQRRRRPRAWCATGS